MRSTSKRVISAAAAAALENSNISYVLERAGEKYPDVKKESAQSPKKNYSEAFSRSLAQLLADILRLTFEGIQPTAEGSGHESLMTGARGSKKIDIR